MTKEQKQKALMYALLGNDLNIKTETIDKLALIAQEASFPRQSVILDIGTHQRYVYLVIQGMARSYYIDEKGNDITKMFMRENEFLIGEALFMDESLEVFEAVEEIKCLRFDAAEMKAVLLGDPVYILQCWKRQSDIRCGVNTLFNAWTQHKDIWSFKRHIPE